MVAAANHGEPISELRQVHGAAKPSLENQNLLVANGASPGRRRRRRGELTGFEISGGGGDLGELVDVGILGQRVLEAGEGGSA